MLIKTSGFNIVGDRFEASNTYIKNKSLCVSLSLVAADSQLSTLVCGFSRPLRDHYYIRLTIVSFTMSMTDRA